MTENGWDRIQQVFDRIVAHPPKARAAALDECCSADPNLRAEVESLLEHDSQAGTDFMRVSDPPGKHASEQPRPDPLIGATVGRCHIESVLASGGMGTVYLAEQQNPRRKVALKVVRAGVASPAALKRFEYEAQILARLRHSAIAQVYEAGTHPDADTGRPTPYFVMEFVHDARTLIDYADRNKLELRERLDLFSRVCDAVHYGHQRGIIHRDLKPANILVDPDCQPKIIDFGVARATDSDVALTTMRTDVGQLVGTLQYMSPEQCDADPHEIDIRTDVYSLGVVLYELLTGRVPYETSGTSIYRAVRIIRETEPAALASIRPRLRGDLEWIVRKALAKQPDDRYASSADLAQDLRRFLKREPIDARPPTPWTRTARWIAVHPRLATISGCLAIAASMIGASLLSQWYLMSRPDRIELVADQSEVRLLALSGREIHNWGRGVPGTLLCSHLIEQPAELGGQRVVLIGYNRSYPDPEFAHQLCAFDVDRDLDRPIWKRRIEPEQIPDVLLKLNPPRLNYEPGQLSIYDVFPERPGDEIVAIFSSEYSQRAIRIYDLAGELLYQVWHDGTCGDRYWMSGPRLLVLAGLHWAYFTPPARAESTISPLSIFAIRPEPGVITRQFLTSMTISQKIAPVWYKFLVPTDAVRVRKCREYLRPPDIAADAADAVRLGITYYIGDGTPGISWSVDADGTLIREKQLVSDEYRIHFAAGELPDPTSYRLVDLKEIAPELDPITPRRDWPPETQNLYWPCDPPVSAPVVED